MNRSSWRALLWPLVPVYTAVLLVKSWLFGRGLLARRSLSHPVLSVGSLSSGGAGKTPIVLMLAGLLQTQGMEVRILSRGFGRRSKLVARVDPAGDAGRFGDEPLLMARRLPGAAVYVGIDRHRAGLHSETAAPTASNVVYLLDDAFQHRRLNRDVDMVLLTRQDLTDHLLPSGNLREPLSALARATIVILREEDADVWRTIETIYPEIAPVRWTIRRSILLPPEARLLRRPLAFCGLARPESFFSMLATEGVQPVAAVLFRDHHPYTLRDIERLVESARLQGADGFLTTEKDAVKLSGPLLRRLEASGHTVAVRLHVDLLDEQEKVAELLALLAARPL